MKHSELCGQDNDKACGCETFNLEKQFFPVT